MPARPPPLPDFCARAGIPRRAHSAARGGVLRRNRAGLSERCRVGNKDASCTTSSVRAELSCCQQRECTIGTWVGATVGRGESV